MIQQYRLGLVNESDTTQMKDLLLLCDNIVLVIILAIILLKLTDHKKTNYSQINLGLLACYSKEDDITR